MPPKHQKGKGKPTTAAATTSQQQQQQLTQQQHLALRKGPPAPKITTTDPCPESTTLPSWANLVNAWQNTLSYEEKDYVPSDLALPTFAMPPIDIYRISQMFDMYTKFTSPGGPWQLTEHTLERLLHLIEPFFYRAMVTQLIDVPAFSNDLVKLRLLPSDLTLYGLTMNDEMKELIKLLEGRYTNNGEISLESIPITQDRINDFQKWLNITHEDANKSRLDSKLDEFIIPTTGFDSLVSLKPDFPEGTGIVALSELNPDDVVMTIPREAMISTDIMQEGNRFAHPTDVEFYEPIIKMLPQVIPMQPLGLTLATAFERIRGTQSRFAKYLDILPNYAPCVASGCTNDLAPLKNTIHYFSALRSYYHQIMNCVQITRQINLFNQRVDNNHAYTRYRHGDRSASVYRHTPTTQLTESTRSKNLAHATNDVHAIPSSTKPDPNMIPPVLDPHAGFTFIPPFSIITFRWAATMASTRQNPIPQLPNNKQQQQQQQQRGGQMLALIPGFDFGNFQIPSDPTRCVINTAYDPTIDAAQTFAMESVSPGEQVYIYYGERPASHFALYQGFIPPMQSIHSHFNPQFTFNGESTLPKIYPNDSLQSLRRSLCRSFPFSTVDVIPFHEHLPAQLPKITPLTTQQSEWSEDDYIHQQKFDIVTNWSAAWKSALIECMDKTEIGPLFTQAMKYAKQFEQLPPHVITAKKWSFLLDEAIIPTTPTNMYRAIVNIIIPTLEYHIKSRNDMKQLYQLQCNTNDGTPQFNMVDNTNYTPLAGVLHGLLSHECNNFSTQLDALKALVPELIKLMPQEDIAKHSTPTKSYITPDMYQSPI